MRRIVICPNVISGETVWTGISGIYETAPQDNGIYEFVEYATDENEHIRFAFEKKSSTLIL